jgi:GST-like protein
MFPAEVVMSEKNHELLAIRGYGSAIVEAAFGVAGVPFDRVEVDASSRERLIAANPLGQVPTLLLPDGTVLTESAAIVLYLNDLRPAAGLVPPVGDADRPRFLRWLVFLVAALYPTFTTGAPRDGLWRQLEEAAGTPWFLGERRSAVDLYLAVMTRWDPAPWFVEHTPKLAAIARRATEEPGIREALASNFGE